MKAEIVLEQEKTYVVIHEKMEQDSFFLNMILQNKILGLAPCENRFFNGSESLYYDVTGKTSLLKLAETKKLEKQDLLRLYKGIYVTVNSLSRFFLKEQDLCFLPELLFLDKDEVSMIYCPCEDTEQNSFLSLSEMLLAFVDPEDEETVVFAYQVYMEVKTSQSSLEKILKEIIREMEQDEKPLFEESTDQISFPMEFYEEEKLATDNIAIEKENPSRMIFLALSILALLYALFLFLRLSPESIGEYLAKKEVICTVSFFLLGICGFLFQLILQKRDSFFSSNLEEKWKAFASKWGDANSSIH